MLRLLRADTELAPLIRPKGKDYAVLREKYSVVPPNGHLRNLRLQLQQSRCSEVRIAQIRPVWRHSEVLTHWKDSPIRSSTQSHSSVWLNRLHVSVQHTHHKSGAVVPQYSLVLDLSSGIQYMHLILVAPLGCQGLSPFLEEGLKINKIVVAFRILFAE